MKNSQRGQGMADYALILVLVSLVVVVILMTMGTGIKHVFQNVVVALQTPSSEIQASQTDFKVTSPSVTEVGKSYKMQFEITPKNNYSVDLYDPSESVSWLDTHIVSSDSECKASRIPPQTEDGKMTSKITRFDCPKGYAQEGLGLTVSFVSVTPGDFTWHYVLHDEAFNEVPLASNQIADFKEQAFPK